MNLKEMSASELQERMAEIRSLVDAEDADLDALEKEAREIKEELERRAAEEAKKQSVRDMLAAGKVPEMRVIEKNQEETKVSEKEKRAQEFVENGSLIIENRQLLATGVLTPTAAKEEIAELPTTICSIVDDVHSFDATGTGAWGYAYRVTDGAAAAVTDGQTIGGTPGTFDKGTITPNEWGILDEISNQVKKFTPVRYFESIRNNAYLALRRYAKTKIVEAVLDSDIAETNVNVPIDENFVRTLVLGFDADESVAGGTKLYLCKEDLEAIGKVRGTNEKKAVFEITFDDENNGTITDGGLFVKFSICSDLKESGTGNINQMLYGQPGAIDMPLWGNYEVTTDEGGDYFKRNMLGIRGLQTAGVALTKYHGMQIVTHVEG